MPVCPRCKASYMSAGKVCPSCQGKPHSVREIRDLAAGPTAEAGLREVASEAPPAEVRARQTSTGQIAAGRTGETLARTPALAFSVSTAKTKASDDPLIGQIPLGQYRIIKKIGEGGFGAVYLAEQLGVDRKAVIKVLHKKLVESPVFVKRFEREASVLARLDHHHLVRLYNFGEFGDGNLFLAMEYGGDSTVADQLKHDGPFAPRRALAIAAQICEALGEAHRSGVVHRDLKPANVLLSKKSDLDWAKLVDVGIAKILDRGDVEDASLTGAGMIIGTPAYFSPEQARGLGVDARSDLYSLGVVLYEMLTGKLPITALTPVDYVRAHAIEAPKTLKQGGVVLPAAVQAILDKALVKDRSKRFQTARELSDALTAAGRSLDAAWAPRTKKMVWSGAVLAVAAGAAAYAVLSRPSQGALDIAFAPETAEVKLDGRRVHAGIAQVAAGHHVLVVRAEGYEAEVDEFELVPGQTLPVRISLNELTSRGAGKDAAQVARVVAEAPRPRAVEAPNGVEAPREVEPRGVAEVPSAMHGPSTAEAPSAANMPAKRQHTARAEAASPPAKANEAAAEKTADAAVKDDVRPAGKSPQALPAAAAPPTAAAKPKPSPAVAQATGSCLPLASATLVDGAKLYSAPDTLSAVVRTLDRDAQACVGLSTTGFGFRSVRLADRTAGFVDDSYVLHLIEPQKAPAGPAAAGAPGASTPAAAALTAALPCGSLSRATLARWSEVHAGPDSNSNTLRRLDRATAACAGRELRGFGFHAVRLPDGTSGFVEEAAVELAPEAAPRPSLGQPAKSVAATPAKAAMVAKAGTASTSEESMALTCRSRSAATIAGRTQIYSAPDATSVIVRTLDRPAVACIDSETRGFGFRAVRLAGGVSGFVEEAALSGVAEAPRKVSK
jgi:tRNA A-37 threonylcarbamoyl transferase component Bud32